MPSTACCVHSRMRMFRRQICFVDFFPTYLSLLADGYRASIPGVCKQHHFVSRCVVELFALTIWASAPAGQSSCRAFSDLASTPQTAEHRHQDDHRLCPRHGAKSLSTLCPSEFMRRPAALPCDARSSRTGTRTCCAWSERPF
jgi:hypothetical protein